MKILEKEFQAQVIELAWLHNWLVAHFRPALTASGRWITPVAADGAGFPDLVLARRGRVIVAELKSQRGQPSTEQKAWLEAFGSCNGIETYLWRPADWNKIEEVLK